MHDVRSDLKDVHVLPVCLFVCLLVAEQIGIVPAHLWMLQHRTRDAHR